MHKITTNFDYRIHGRMWIEGPDGPFLGIGRVMLLELIRDTGSISAAARAMKMSYRHAWELVDSMNSQSQAPIVKKMTGGRGGGGAQLTEAGAAAITAFRAAEEAFAGFLANQSCELSG
jgi:molybdate transport system regulatory protein